MNNRIFVESLIEFGSYKRILDIGWGLGGLSALLKRRIPSAEVIGCDISETAIRKACQLHPEVSFHCMDLLTDSLLAFGRVDLVTMSETLWYVLEDLEQVFLRIASILEPGGTFGLHQYFPHDQRYGREIIDGLPGFDRFLVQKTQFVTKCKITVQSKADGLVLLSTYNLREA